MKKMFRMNLSKHRSTRFVQAKDKLKSIRSPLVESHRAISSEYKIPIYEVVKKNNRINDTIPVHCRIDLKLFLIQELKLI